MSNSYPRSSSSGSFAPDRIWGTIFIVLYALMLLAILLVILGIGGITALSGTHGGNRFAPLFGAAFVAIAGMILVFVSGVHIVGAIGIHKGRAWGFWLTIILSVVSLASSGGGTCLTVGPLLYSILRLAGAYGPKPD